MIPKPPIKNTNNPDKKAPHPMKGANPILEDKGSPR